MFRCSGEISHRIIPIEYTAFQALVSGKLSLPVFRVVVTSETTAAYVNKLLSVGRKGWLHVSPENDAHGPLMRDFTNSKLKQYVKSRLETLREEHYDSHFVDICQSLLSERGRGIRYNQLPRTGHNLTRANEIALQAFGCQLRNLQGSGSPVTEDNAVRWIIRSYDEVQKYRRRLLRDRKERFVQNTLCLALPAMLRRSYGSAFLNQLTPASDQKRLLRAFLHSRTYIPVMPDGLDVSTLDAPPVRAVLQLRQRELALHTATLVRTTSGALVPSMRVSPKANGARGELKHLAECARANSGPHVRRKLKRLLTRSQVALEAGLDKSLSKRLAQLGDRVHGVKLACELPLEWLRMRGVPLMLRHECSRIPLVPAGLSYKVATDQDPVLVPPSALIDVLVIRSFAADDPIRNFLQLAIEAGPDAKWQTTWTVTVRFVDVTNPEEIVTALNEYNGAIVVFDCHGHFDTRGYVASLMIGGKPARLWELRTRISRMPPIVMLSACDTLPLDSSHTAVAISMLLLGAKTVLATVLPISARHAAIFIGRMLLRIGEFVPLALSMGRRVSWREIISGMLKMAHTTEVLQTLVHRRLISDDDYAELHQAANADINRPVPNWLERASDRLAARIGCSRNRAWQLMVDDVGPTEAMLHVQLGHPELIWLVAHNPEELA